MISDGAILWLSCGSGHICIPVINTTVKFMGSVGNTETDAAWILFPTPEFSHLSVVLLKGAQASSFSPNPGKLPILAGMVPHVNGGSWRRGTLLG